MRHSTPSPETNRRFSSIEDDLKNVHKQNETALVTQTKILSTLDRIDDHMSVLHDKVVSQDKELFELTAQHNQFKTWITAVATVISTLVGLVWTAVNFIFK